MNVVLIGFSADPRKSTIASGPVSDRLKREFIDCDA